MTYDNICEGTFISRPNRFIAEVNISGKLTLCHVKNTGRCKELLVPGAKVYLQRVAGETRKTDYDLIAVEKGERLVNMDSSAPNKAVYEWLIGGASPIKRIGLIKPEVVFQNSRFDFCINTTDGGVTFIEVKGVTLEEEGAVFFPDAPTLRGIKHIDELCRAADMGFNTVLLFVVQMQNVRYFSPNIKTHPEFKDALIRGRKAGVKLIAMDCVVTTNSMTINKPVPIRL